MTSLLLGGLSVVIGTVLYKNVMNERYQAEGQTAAGLMTLILQGDELQKYLDNPKEDAQYQTIQNKLLDIRDNNPEIEYIYVYDIEEDGCHVIFDLDTEELPGAKLGEVVAFDESFREYLPVLLAGGEIEPVVVHGQYGWLLTIYKPIYASNGECVAYGAVDIQMESVITDCYIFAIRLICLLFGASLFIILFSLKFIQEQMVNPLDSLVEVSGRFAYDNESRRKENVKHMHELNISTRDEIENLYHAISKTTDDVCTYIQQSSEKSEEILKQAMVISQLQDRIIIAFAAMVENRDENTGGHINRTARYVGIVARHMAKTAQYANVLTEEYIKNMVKSAPLHDIGKIRIPDNILNKSGRLTDEEFEIMKTHTTAGKEILDEVFHDISAENCFSQAVNMAYCHHEKWDGSGYPRGIGREQIPICARIMAIADVFDALTSKRSYKKAFSVEKAIAIIREESGSHFDPVAVNAFCEALDEIRIVVDTRSVT